MTSSSTITHADTGGYVWINNNDNHKVDLSLLEMQIVYAMLSQELWHRNSDIKMGMILDSQEANEMEDANKRYLRFNGKDCSVAQYMELADTII